MIKDSEEILANFPSHKVNNTRYNVELKLLNEMKESLKNKLNSKLVKHTVKRINKDTKLYRGKEIEMNDHIPTGYNGRYTIGKGRFTTLKEAKAHIDKLCQEKGIDSFMTKEEEKEHLEMYKD